ncbi:hypothetical protein [Thalassotalea euphylliae]|uniref:Uncharacterized protein n=1 Tax=Thalassotalea euphylliae TaxID=1655234 RepID=A0A3E0U271_9GAMM|nr:hypothetical protein [Thalassotalea euphylliae]REL31081.1 hypothetical protein DXX94_10340 [Thalassotalea euphylliae]
MALMAPMVNMKKLLADQQAALETKVDSKAAETQSLVTAKTTETKSHITTGNNETKSLVQTENDATQTILANASTGDDLNANTLSVNSHTTAKVDQAKSALSTQIENSRSNQNSVVVAARDAIKAELVRQTTGSLYNLLYQHVDTRVRSAEIAIKGGNTISEVLSEVNTERATIVNAVNAARDNIKNGLTNKAVRDAVIAELTRTTAGSLYNLLEARLIAHRDEAITRINDGSNNNDIYNLVISKKDELSTQLENSRVNQNSVVTGARDGVKSHVTNVLGLYSPIRIIRRYTVEIVQDASGIVDVPITAVVDRNKTHLNMISHTISSSGKQHLLSSKLQDYKTVRLTARTTSLYTHYATFEVIEYK